MASATGFGGLGVLSPRSSNQFCRLSKSL
jgi:hypothetical protein